MKHDHPELGNTRIIRFIVDDRYKLLRHAVLLLGALVIITFSNVMSDYSGAYMYQRLLCVYGALIGMSYININILVPRYFFKGRYIIYLLLLFLLVMLCEGLLSYSLNTLFAPAGLSVKRNSFNGARGFYEGTIILVSIILVTTMVKLFQRWMRDSERMTELKNLTLTMELSELRKQVSPHFLFNMLNGIKALVRTDPEKANLVIMKLSEFLRYQLYENNDKKILLRSELNFLSNFLDLEKLRRDNLSVNINTQIEPSVLNRIFLPPSLFTIFVENAVKHSADLSGAGSCINITCGINEDKLCFSCMNSKDPGYILSDEKNSGLGLANIKRRLELLYGDNYVLEISSTTTTYNTQLTIPI
jgi:sensor histidine kinase YesM